MLNGGFNSLTNNNLLVFIFTWLQWFLPIISKILNQTYGGTPSGWCHSVIGPFFRARFVKQKNIWRDSVKVVHDVWREWPFVQGVIRETAEQLAWWCESRAWRDGVIGSFSLT